MAVRLNPYLSFPGNAREAMEFYQAVFGGKLDVTTFKEANSSPDPSHDNNVMHAVLEVENGITLMGSDTIGDMKAQPGSNISISLSGDDEVLLKGYFDKLTVGGTVTMPLDKAPWGDSFGMLNDKFGIAWMVNISAKPA